MTNPLQHGLPVPEPVGVVVDPRPLYRRWIKPGDLVFDIGANVGERVKVFRQLHAEVVAVEPQADVAALIPSADGMVHVEVAACTFGRGSLVPLWRCQANHYMTTTIADYPNKVQIHAASFGGYAYDAQPELVPAVSLDELIARYGVPAFIKIDVEGGEANVLAGLSQPIAALSFEVHDFDPGKAATCIDLLDQLGDYRYSYSQGESFELDSWPPTERIVGMFGDIYAELAGSNPAAVGAAANPDPAVGRAGPTVQAQP